MQIMDFINKPVRADAILTNAYVAGTVLENAQTSNVMTINYNFTKGSLTDAQIKVEVSTDGSTYYHLQSDSISAGVNTLAPLVYKLAATSVGSTTPLTINTKYIKISAIGTGTVTSSSLAINVVLGKI